MKVLHISGATSWGGNEQQLINTIPALEQLNVENLVFGVKNTPIHKKSIENSIEFVFTEEKKLNKFSNYKFLKNIVKKEKPDIIHLHTSNALTVYVLSDLLFKLKTPTVFSKKGMGSSMSWLSLYKYNYRNINGFICVSKSVENAFKKILHQKHHHKLSVVYDGIKTAQKESSNIIDLREKFLIDDSKILIGNIANHTAAKDLITLVETVHELVNGLGAKNIFIVQIGEESDLTPSIVKLIDDYNLRPYFAITGFVENAADMLSQMDIFIMTSEREGGPSSVLEAMYKKIPIVTTKVGVTTEAIVHDDNGMLSKVKDYKSLANNLKVLIEDQEKRIKFADKSYKIFLNKFTVNHLAKNTLRIYYKLVKAH